MHIDLHMSAFIVMCVFVPVVYMYMHVIVYCVCICVIVCCFCVYLPVYDIESST